VKLDIPIHSIGDLAQLTGLTVSTLRAWEQRYTFPVPTRLDSGHRRYTERDVVALRQVGRDRQAGINLAAALERARQQVATPRGSIMATMRHVLSDIAPVELSKRTLMTMSRAIEDEAATRADHPVLVGAFQEQRYLRQSRQRWNDLATTSLATIIFTSPPRRRQRGVIWEVPIVPETSLTREWAVICDSSTFGACLVATEHLKSEGTIQSSRCFDSLWTVEPAAIREAVRTAAALADLVHPALRDVITSRLEEPLYIDQDTARAATSLSNRMIQYLDRSARLP
jgi:DNA-binding transcriptional MerR regulator